MGKSHQKGWVSQRGRKWYGYFRRTVIDPDTNQPKTVSTPVPLGLKSEMTKYEAREKLELEIKKLTGQITEDGVVRNGSVTFGWFVRNRYLPLKEADWKEETAKVKRYLIQADITDAFEHVRLENIDKLTLQAHLNRMAKTRSRDRVLQVRAYIRAIFAEAVEQDFLAKDPARSVKVPSELKETDKTTLSWDQLRAALSRLPLRDRILLTLDMTNALRPSELFAFRWKCHHTATVSLTIVETIYKGKIRSFGKTKGSLTEVPIAKELSDDLIAWRQISQEEYDRRNQQQRKKNKQLGRPPSDLEAFMFPGRFGSFMDPNNYRKRVMHKLALELGLPKLTFQVIRRTIATLAKDKGHVKDIQGMMRHSRLATTTEIYMQSLESGVRSTIDSIHHELRGTGTRGGGPKAPANRHVSMTTNGARTNAPESSNFVREEETIKRPVRGVILEFATKMRQSRRGEVPSSY
jgi:integrase